MNALSSPLAPGGLPVVKGHAYGNDFLLAPEERVVGAPGEAAPALGPGVDQAQRRRGVEPGPQRAPHAGAEAQRFRFDRAADALHAQVVGLRAAVAAGQEQRLRDRP